MEHSGCHDLTQFTLADMVQLGRSMRSLADGCGSVEGLARRVTTHLFDSLRGRDTHQRQSALVRCYLTVGADTVHALTGAQPPFAHSSDRSARYLSLVASRGLLPAWNDRRSSVGHKALALDPAALRGTPMIAALLQQLGVTQENLSSSTPTGVTHPEDVHFGVLHVAEAVGSPQIPDQDFVREHGVRSALGFGGLLPTGELFVVVMFLRVPVPASVAAMFRTVSLSLRLGLLELDQAPFLADALEPVLAARPDIRPTARAAGSKKRGRILQAERAMLKQLLLVHEQTTLAESERASEASRRWQAEAQRSTMLARTLQDSLLPAALPDLTGFGVAAVFRPAGDGSEVGGDFYDVFATDSTSGWFVVGDVSGKGAHAAALTSLARYTLRAVSSSVLSTPSNALRRLNDAVLAHPGDRHLTAVVGTFSVTTGRLDVTLALAGHPPAVLLLADGTVQEAGIPGTALGMFPTIDITQVHLTLGPGDALLMFTDGVTEARGRNGGFYGEQRLAKLLIGLAGTPLLDLPETVAEDVLAYQNQWPLTTSPSSPSVPTLPWHQPDRPTGGSQVMGVYSVGGV